MKEIIKNFVSTPLFHFKPGKLNYVEKCERKWNIGPSAINFTLYVLCIHYYTERGTLRK